jgi:hypothetical protein
MKFSSSIHLLIIEYKLCCVDKTYHKDERWDIQVGGYKEEIVSGNSRNQVRPMYVLQLHVSTVHGPQVRIFQK